MKRLPKVPDIVKVPKKNELSYTSEELNVLKIQMWSKFQFATGVGKRKFRIKTLERVLSSHPDDAVREYRREFFTELLRDKSELKKLKKAVQRLPEITPNSIYSTNYSREMEKIRSFSQTLETIAQWNGRSKAFRELKVSIPRFLKIAHRMDNETTVAVSKQFRKQLMTYFLFAYICDQGCKPKFLDSEKREGYLVAGTHPAYGDWKDNPNWRGPRLFENSIPNDASWGPKKRMALITGSNSMGKSVYLRMIGLNVLLAMNGFYASANEMKLSPVRRIWSCFDFGDKKGRGHLETGQEYVAKMRDLATRDDLLLIDEPAQGTEPAVEYKLAKGLISNLAYLGGFNSFVVTHDISLVREFEDLEGVSFQRVADYEDKRNKFKLLEGISEGGYGIRLAQKCGTDSESLEKKIRERIAKGNL